MYGLGFKAPLKIDLTTLKQRICDSSNPGPPGDVSFQRATVFLILFDLLEPHVLAIQKTDTEGYPWRNQVALPGGHVEESDPTALAAAYRELKEEVDIGRDQIEFIGSIGHFQTINHRDIQVFVGWWKEQSEIQFDSMEISRILKTPRPLNYLSAGTLLVNQAQIRNLDKMMQNTGGNTPYHDILVWINKLANIRYPSLVAFLKMDVGQLSNRDFENPCNFH